MASLKSLMTRAFWKDKRNARMNETIGGGFIVAKRGRDSGRVRMPQWPFEHATFEGARDEAQRLAVKHPGQQFVVLTQASDLVVAMPDPLDVPVAADAALTQATA